MDISNLVYINNDDFYYPFKEGNLYFVKDTNLPFDKAAISPLPNLKYNTSHVIYYNFSPYSVLSSFPSELTQIYNGYIKAGSFNDPKASPGAWAKYNDQLNYFILKFPYIFNVQKDFSSVATCKYLTSSLNVVNSENYHYANSSKGSICSQPTVIKNNEGKISYCSMIIDHPCNCPLFEEDKKIISTYKVSSKNSSLSFNITSFVSRFLDHINIFVENSQNNEKIFSVKLSTLQDISYEEILKETSFLMNEALSAYPSTFYSLEEQELPLSTSVSISKKKSYLASLV